MTDLKTLQSLSVPLAQQLASVLDQTWCRSDYRKQKCWQDLVTLLLSYQKSLVELNVLSIAPDPDLLGRLKNSTLLESGTNRLVDDYTEMAKMGPLNTDKLLPQTTITANLETAKTFKEQLLRFKIVLGDSAN